MDFSDLESLQRGHGVSVPRYLKYSNKVQKTDSGAFICIREYFDKCLELVTNKTNAACEKNLKEKPGNVEPGETTRKRKRSIIEHEDYQMCEQMLVSDMVESPEEKSEIAAELEKSLKDLSVASHMSIGSTETEQKPLAPALIFSSCTTWPLKPRYNGKELYELMMKADGAEPDSDYNACLTDIHLILTEFLNRHGNCLYYSILRRVLKGKNQKIPKAQFEVTLEQYQLFVYKVIAGVIPKALFGCNKNLKILRNTLKKYYLAPYQTPLDPSQCILRLNISQIPWLQKIENTNTQRLVIGKVTKWLFENFFIRLFEAVFRERKSLYCDRRIIMSTDMWNKFQRDYISSQVKANCIAKADPDDDFRMADLLHAIMKLYPKSRGVRPIYQLRPTDYENEELEFLRTLLQQLYKRKYNTMNDKLHTTWLSYAKATEINPDCKVNVVTCDVDNAFGSIIQKKLFDIVNRMIDELPDEYLRLQCYEILLPKSKHGSETTHFKRWFDCWPETFSAPNRSLIAISKRSGDEVLYVKKEYLQTKLAAYIFEQYFEYRNEEYLLKIGIMQGSPLSPILSDIYYQHMMIEEFGIFMQSGTLLRYVDDYIYITTNEDSARRFLKAIKGTVPEYNCRFKKTKIQTNMKSRACKGSDWVNYLGFELNGKTMEVRPKYEKPQFQYGPCMKRVAGSNSLPILAKLLKNISCLKLSSIVLNAKINSSNTLSTSARVAAETLATRCAIFIKTIFSDPSNHKDDILRIIRRVMKRIEAIFSRHLTALDRKKRLTLRRNIKITIRQSFLRVFKRFPELRKPFCLYLKTIIYHQTIL